MAGWHTVLWLPLIRGCSCCVWQMLWDLNTLDVHCHCWFAPCLRFVVAHDLLLAHGHDIECFLLGVCLCGSQSIFCAHHQVHKQCHKRELVHTDALTLLCDRYRPTEDG
jgi:hypothetical protein